MNADHARLKANAEAYLHALERANKHGVVDNYDAKLAIRVWKVTIEGLEFVMKGEGVPASPSLGPDQMIAKGDR